MAAELLRRNSDNVAISFRDEHDHISSDFVDAVFMSLATGNRNSVLSLVRNLHEADLGDLIEALSRSDRAAFIALLGDEFDFNALTEVDDSTRLELLEAMPNDRVAEGVLELDSDDAVSVLEDMEEEDQDEILAKLPAFDREQLKRSLDYPEDSAGRRMQSEFIAVAPFWTVGQTIDHLREADDLPVDFNQIFVVDPGYHLQGVVSLDNLLRNKRPVAISDIMNLDAISIKARDDQEDVSRLFERYDLLAAAVVDNSNRLVGVLTIDDIVDVIQEEADEDIKHLGGVGDEDISDRVLEITRSRFSWLVLNLLTAILASFIISLFDTTIENMVALAILMPIVASMGGNAATQTMTVAVRALATQDLDSYNMKRVVLRELFAATLNGVALGIITGIVAAIWFQLPELGVVIGAALIINMVSAGLCGILIPVGLDRVGIDPAVASSVFVTTVTDVVGFFAFLGIAGWWFAL